MKRKGRRGKRRKNKGRGRLWKVETQGEEGEKDAFERKVKNNLYNTCVHYEYFYKIYNEQKTGRESKHKKN